MMRRFQSVILVAAVAGLMTLPACRKNEYRSTSVYTSTNDASSPANRPNQANQNTHQDDDYDFVAPQGRMVVDPD